MSAAVTCTFYFTITSAVFVHEMAYQLIGQRTHSNGKTPRRLRGHWVLPEVLKDPGAYYVTQQNMNRISKTLVTLLHNTIQVPKVPINKRFNYRKKINVKNKYIKNKNKYNKK